MGGLPNPPPEAPPEKPAEHYKPLVLNGPLAPAVQPCEWYAPSQVQLCFKRPSKP